jgi:hypothetical protein
LIILYPFATALTVVLPRLLTLALALLAPAVVLILALLKLAIVLALAALALVLTALILRRTLQLLLLLPLIAALLAPLLALLLPAPLLFLRAELLLRQDHAAGLRNAVLGTGGAGDKGRAHHHADRENRLSGSLLRHVLAFSLLSQPGKRPTLLEGAKMRSFCDNHCARFLTVI